MKSYEEEVKDEPRDNDQRKGRDSRSPSYQSNEKNGKRGGRSESERSRSPRGRRSPRRSPPRRRATDNADFTQIYVAGISQSTSADDIEKLFDKCGQIKDIVMKNKYAFIDFNNHDDAVDAISRYNRTSLHGDTLTVE